MLLSTKCRLFSPPFLHLHDKHVFMINMFITNGMYLAFHFLSYPEPPMGISGVDPFTVLSGASPILSSSFRSRKLALIRINHLHLGVVLDAFCLVWQAYRRSLTHLHVHTSVCTCVCQSVCPCIHPFVHLYVYIYLLVHLYGNMSPMENPSYVSVDMWGFIHVVIRFIHAAAVCRHTIIYRACQLACCWPTFFGFSISFYLITEVCYHEPEVFQKKNALHYYIAIL